MYVRFILLLGLVTVATAEESQLSVPAAESPVLSPGSGDDAHQPECKLPVFYRKAIDQMYETTPTEVLAAYIQDIYDNDNPQSYEIMVEAQIYLYWRYATYKRAVNSEYLRNVGYYLRQIRTNNLYQNLTKAVHSRLGAVIQELPTSLQHLYLEPYFCLLNNLYSEFFYTTDAIDFDDHRRYVFTWTTPNSVANNGRWNSYITEKTDPEIGYMKLQFALWSNVTSMYMQLERNNTELMNTIDGWRPGSLTPTSIWTVELVGNFLVLSQNGYIMCAGKKFYDPDRRFVYGYNDGHTNESKNCQWIAKDCPN